MLPRRHPASPAPRLRAAVWITALAVILGSAVALSAKGGKTPGLLALSAALAGTTRADPRQLLAGGDTWLNTAPLRAEDLRGKVLLVNFWTYSCINSLRPLPYVRAWAEKYRDRGLVVIGVHTPEFGFERDLPNVRRALTAQGIAYPVLLDSDYRIWRAFGNSAWPAFYFIGADGRVRRQALGEGGYDKSEQLIQALLAEARHAPVADPVVAVPGTGVQAAPDWTELGSEETYVGYDKATGFASHDGLRHDQTVLYHPATRLALGGWSLAGQWNVGGESAILMGGSGAIAYRFHARDLNLVLAPPPGGQPVRFRVRLDGRAPGRDHGFDTDDQGWGVVDAPRLYQLVRQGRRVADRTFEIEFLGPGARAYVFTFG